MAVVQQSGLALLRGSTEGGSGALRQADHLQYGQQGSQYTSDSFLDVLRAAEVAISMDGKGRWRGQRESRAAVAFGEVRERASARLERSEGGSAGDPGVGWSSTTGSDRIRHWGTEHPTMSTGPTGRHGKMWRKKRKAKIFTTPAGVVKSAGVYLKSRVNPSQETAPPHPLDISQPSNSPYSFNLDLVPVFPCFGYGKPAFSGVPHGIASCIETGAGYRYCPTNRETQSGRIQANSGVWAIRGIAYPNPTGDGGTPSYQLKLSIGLASDVLVKTQTRCYGPFQAEERRKMAWNGVFQ